MIDTPNMNPAAKDAQRSEIDAAVAAFQANGGQITQVPMGEHTTDDDDGLAIPDYLDATKRKDVPSTQPKEFVMLANEKTDYGLVEADKARDRAQELADQDGTKVTIRNAVTDEVIDTMKPTEKQARKRVTSDPIEAAWAATGAKKTKAAKPAPKAKAAAPKAKAAKPAKPAAKKVVKAAAKPAEKKAAAKPAAKATKSEPTGMVKEIIKLALRPKGVTPAELNELTKWKGAPWKWFFQNKKGTGYADRWGYDFSVTKDDAGTHYKLAKK